MNVCTGPIRAAFEHLVKGGTLEDSAIESRIREDAKRELRAREVTIVQEGIRKRDHALEIRSVETDVSELRLLKTGIS